MNRISLLDAFGLSTSCRAAIVGSGGKTSLLFRLARAFTPPVLLSNSAHLAVEQGRFADRVVMVNQLDDLAGISERLLEGVTLVTGPADHRGRTQGLDGKLLSGLQHLVDNARIPLLIEADGSRGLPLKAPADWEPPIPDFVNTVIVTIGLGGLGKPLTADWVYRPDDFGRIAGLKLGDEIDIEALASVMRHPRGGLKNIPGQTIKVGLLNQADTPELQEKGASLARMLVDDYSRIVVASLHGPDPHGQAAEIHAVHQKTAGIILAAGAASRMGQPKQLLDWQGEPLVNRQVRAALEAGLAPVIVVTGAYAEEVTAVLNREKIRVVSNGSWRDGQSSSVKAGVAGLEPEIGAAVFFLVDQPFINAEIVRRLVACHDQSLAPIIAPRVGGRRGNPVLFDRRTFADLAEVTGDSGGRQVMAKWGTAFVEWADERLLVDIDSLEDYRQAKSLG